MSFTKLRTKQASTFLSTLLAASMLLLAESAEAAPWWNPSWQYLRWVTVTAGTAAVPVGYTVSTTLDHAALVTASTSLANGNDLRVVYTPDGLTWIELDRVLDPGSSWNSANTRIWFKLQAAIPASTSHVRYALFYGNAGAGAPPANGSNVFLHWDGFESGNLSGWGSVWQDPGDTIVAQNTTVRSGTFASRSVTNGTDPGQATVRAEYAAQPGVHTVQYVRFPAGYVFNADTSVQQLYGGFWGQQQLTVNVQGGTRQVFIWNNWAPQAYFGSTIVATNTWYRLEMKSIVSPTVGRVELWVNGVREVNASNQDTGTVNIDNNLAGIYWKNSGPNTLFMDDCFTRKWVDPEPTATVQGQETTAVKLIGFSARGFDSGVELSWQTASELDNLGFHLYRAESAEGPYERITATAIPGLGSSPAGARYRYVDSAVANGETYFYQLEDIETTGRTERHGPVSATPSAGTSGEAPKPSSGGIAYGRPASSSFEVVARTRTELVLELRTEGFEAELTEQGSVQLLIPGFDVVGEPGTPALPVKRSWVEVEPGRGVHVASVQAEPVETFRSLRPSATESFELTASRRGTVRAGRRARREGAAFQGPGLYPEEWARLVSVGYQGAAKKTLLELSPLRWDRTTGQLVLARRLQVRLTFSGQEEPTHRESSYQRQRGASAGMAAVRLAARERGLYRVSFEEALLGRAVPISSLRLSRQGQPVAFHLEPDNGVFGRGSRLYFWSEGASLNPYGHEALYELERAAGGRSMPRGSSTPSGAGVNFYWQRMEREENRYYQAALLEAEDLWLWDTLLAPVEKNYPFEVSALAATPMASRLSLRLQGASDFEASPDHHVRVRVNGALVAETSFEGKTPLRLETEIPAGVLREGENLLSVDNVGDTAADYSMVMLDRFAVDYPRQLRAVGGKLEGEFRESGEAEIRGVSNGALVLDMTEEPARWLDGGKATRGGLRLPVESGRRYLVVDRGAVLKPEIRRPVPSRLKSNRNRADYLMVGPRDLVEAAAPLLELRQSQGLSSRAVPLDEIYSEFGHGEARPEAIREFLSYAYHHWRKPAPRYVVLLGDSTYDFKDYLGTGVKNQLPPLIVKTSYLWTASDPAYATVNGEDILPDLAIGRLPAATADELRVMVRKLLDYEGNASQGAGATVLVADNPDDAGNFEQNAEELASGVLASQNPRRIYLGRLGAAPTRQAIVDALDEGASVLSYIGHGGIQLWAQENVFDSSEVAGLSHQSAQPVVLTLNCLNGYFHFPYFNSLSEELLKADGKGAIAAFSPSGLSLNEPAHLFHTALLRELVSGQHARLGDAVLAAQENYAATGAFPELLSIYSVLGDPALKLR